MVKNLSIRTEKSSSRLMIPLFFVMYLIIGLLIFKNYGMSWDEVPIREYGVLTHDYLVKGDHALYDRGGRYHGTVFETPLVFLEKIFRLQDVRDIYWMRHLVTFLVFFSGVYFFYRLATLLFKSWKWGLLGSFFLVISPRIFADSFYNTKDIPCLVLFIISIYTLIQFLHKKSLPMAFCHALVNALLIDIRILGVVIPFLTLIFWFGDFWLKPGERNAPLRTVGTFAVYGTLLVGLTVLFWPVLWEDPIGQFIRALQQMAHYSWYNTVLYFGNYIPATQVPWHYIPVWILITTPLLYTILFLVGVVILLVSFLKNPLKLYQSQRDWILVGFWFFLPLAAVIVGRSVLYDAWRQLFFIYPAFLLLSLKGFAVLFQWTQKKRSWIGKVLLTALLIAGLSEPIYFMVRYHPYQNIYFNVLTGTMKNAKNNFEMDYWGLSYRRGLEFILKTDTAAIIKVAFHRKGGARSFNLLAPEERRRLMLVEDPKDANYFLSNYRWHKEDYPYSIEVFSLIIKGAKIMTVFKLRD